MKLFKNFGKTMNSDLTTLLIMVGVIVLIFTILQFTKRKTTNTDAMENAEEDSMVDSSPMGQSSEPVFTNVNGIGTSGVPKNCQTHPVANPTELLPNDSNSEWSALNPTGNHDLQNVNLLSAGYLNGINTVGSSLRNANLQVRSEPAIPRADVGPFLNSTIEPDVTRKTLEIGAAS